MSDVIAQQCNVCGAVNTTKANNWTRIFGATPGRSMQPITIMQPRLPGQPNARKLLDFCPVCAPKTTVDKVPGLFLAKPTP